MIRIQKTPLTKTPSIRRASAEDQRKGDAGPSEMSKDGVQGEGNYKAAREFNEAERKFVASGKVAAAARAAAPKSEAERQEMFAAEEEGKHRAKGEDPTVTNATVTNATPDSAAPTVGGKDTARKHR
jgi:hypothetical protein